MNHNTGCLHTTKLQFTWSWIQSGHYFSFQEHNQKSSRIPRTSQRNRNLKKTLELIAARMDSFSFVRKILFPQITRCVVSQAPMRHLGICMVCFDQFICGHSWKIWEIGCSRWFFASLLKVNSNKPVELNLIPLC